MSSTPFNQLHVRINPHAPSIRRRQEVAAAINTREGSVQTLASGTFAFLSEVTTAEGGAPSAEGNHAARPGASEAIAGEAAPGDDDHDLALFHEMVFNFTPNSCSSNYRVSQSFSNASGQRSTFSVTIPTPPRRRQTARRARLFVRPPGRFPSRQWQGAITAPAALSTRVRGVSRSRARGDRNSRTRVREGDIWSARAPLDSSEESENSALDGPFSSPARSITDGIRGLNI